MFCFFFKKTCFFFFLKTLLKKNEGQNVFFSKPHVFKVNIHNLSQFVNHTVTLVQNKNNNERIFEMRDMRLVFKKKTFFFSNDVYSGKKIFLKICFFSSVFFFYIFFKCVYFAFESCLSLIMASGSQLKVKTIKYIILIVFAGCFIINIPYHLNM